MPSRSLRSPVLRRAAVAAVGLIGITGAATAGLTVAVEHAGGTSHYGSVPAAAQPAATSTSSTGSSVSSASAGTVATGGSNGS